MSRFSLEKTYEIAEGPPPEPFQLYEARVRADFRKLLNGDPKESEVQRFLERHPCLVPGIRSLGRSPSAFPPDSLLISQPQLSGLRTRIPDFLWIAQTSVATYPTFIEIERPSKLIFTRQRVPSSEFSQARHQLAHWRAWLDIPSNKASFANDYAIRPSSTGDRSLRFHYILLFGRRVEFESDLELSRERAVLLDEQREFLVSYDRLEPDRSCNNTVMVRASGNGRFKAIAVSPTFTLGPNHARRLLKIDGLEEAILASEIPASRTRFLVERLDYWRDWAAGPQRGISNSSDHE